MARVLLRPEDSRCRYSTFKIRHGGRIPCLAIGQNIVGNANDKIGQITGIAFQKVDTGIVKPVLPNDDFIPLDWPNAPTYPEDPPGPNLALGAPPQNPPPFWQEFATTMLHAKNAMLTKMTVPGAAQPDSLLKGMHRDQWMDGNNVSTFLGLEIEDKVEALSVAMGANWSSNRRIEEWIDDIAGGLYSSTSFRELFIALFPDGCIRGQQGIVAPPAETSKNASIRKGVLHCLPFGYHELQKDESRERSRRREYLSNRTLLRRELRLKARSRSRSPISSDDDLTMNVVNITQPGPQIKLQHMLNNPDSYILKNDLFYEYFEPHKPDYLFYSKSTVESEEFAGVVKSEYKMKLVVEVSSQQKFGDEISLQTHVEHTTEQCVQQCVAGVSLNQENVYGLVVVVDGLKLIKLERRQNPARYFISETSLVTWDQTQNLYAILEMINNAIQ